MEKKLKKKIHKNIISASEIGQYQYCSIAWKLKKMGFEPESELLQIGKDKHESHGKIINHSEKLIKKSYFYKIIGFLLIIITILYFIIEVVF
jgi:hypothetical protein